ncbi:MAG TPA: hypothetical protein VLH18_07600 [Candidatus Limnocylindrales bacterium]|nr:hypothetical protein [Candidatus Limnocylindrales bacterium]
MTVNLDCEKANAVSIADCMSAVDEIREMAFRGLQQMFRANDRLFIYRLIRSGPETVPQGLGFRYTAMTVIGLSGEGDAIVRKVLGGLRLHDICRRLVKDIHSVENMGDVALTLWACHAAGFLEREETIKRLIELKPDTRDFPTVEMAWALDALTLEHSSQVAELKKNIARRLLQSFNQQTGVFPHVVGDSYKGFRAHVSCFADMVYPIHALSNFSRLAGDAQALDAAERCAGQICRLQGAAGQWWWHYDYRTGDVVEGYPVYSVHQDAMAPMALFALEEAGGSNHRESIAKGLNWIYRPAEVSEPLLDHGADLIWRKVGRREPKKAARYIQAAASRLHPSIRVPGMNRIFRADLIDFEDRPYHLGWVLFAWSRQRIAKLKATP